MRWEVTCLLIFWLHSFSNGATCWTATLCAWYCETDPCTTWLTIVASLKKSTHQVPDLYLLWEDNGIFSLARFSFLSPQHDHQTSCWSGTYIILINSLKFKEECFCNCMRLNRNSPWTPHISLLSVFASYKQLTNVPTPFAEQLCTASWTEAISTPTLLSLGGLCLSCFSHLWMLLGSLEYRLRRASPPVVHLRGSVWDVRSVS